MGTSFCPVHLRSLRWFYNSSNNNCEPPPVPPPGLQVPSLGPCQEYDHKV